MWTCLGCLEEDTGMRGICWVLVTRIRALWCVLMLIMMLDTGMKYHGLVGVMMVSNTGMKLIFLLIPPLNKDLPMMMKMMMSHYLVLTSLVSTTLDLMREFGMKWIFSEIL